MSRRPTRQIVCEPALSPGDLMRDASRLFAAGDFLPAAVLGRAALDTFLRDRVTMLGLVVLHRDCCLERLHARKRAGYLTKDEVHEMLELSDVGNRAAHNRVVTSDEVCGMIQRLTGFVAAGPPD